MQVRKKNTCSLFLSYIFTVKKTQLVSQVLSQSQTIMVPNYNGTMNYALLSRHSIYKQIQNI